MSTRRMVGALLTSMAIGAVAVGCDSGTAATAGPTNVAVTLQEWAVVPDKTSVASGDVTFVVTNSGPNDEHEFVIVRTDLDAGALPTDATGKADESGGEIEEVGEVEDIEVGDTGELKVNLAPGSYVLLCNIYSADEDEAHYALGMRINFDVEG